MDFLSLKDSKNELKLTSKYHCIIIIKCTINPLIDDYGFKNLIKIF